MENQILRQKITNLEDGRNQIEQDIEQAKQTISKLSLQIQKKEEEISTIIQENATFKALIQTNIREIM